MIPSALDLSREERIVYRGEGGSAIVVALVKARSVLRFLKHETREDQKERLEKSIDFSQNVWNHVFSRVFSTSQPILVTLKHETRAQIERLARDQRPAQRRDTPFYSSLALLLPDYCLVPRSAHLFGPIVAIELKPKQGFLPSKEVLSDSLELKSRICRFGLKQFFKLRKGSITSRSNYCPLDLFSGCPQRQLLALRNLVENPQNNLRVFRDAEYAFGDQSNNSFEDAIKDFVSNSDEMLRLVLQSLNLCLVSPKSGEKLYSCVTCSLHAKNACVCECGEREEHSLTEGSVLEAILRVQTLDSIDCLLANEMLKALQDNNNEELDSLALPKLWAQRERAPNETQREFFARKLWQFVTSLTAKDCSIMIAIQRTRSFGDLRVGEKEFAVCVRVTDIQPKQLLKVSRILSKEKRIINAFSSLY